MFHTGKLIRYRAAAGTAVAVVDRVRDAFGYGHGRTPAMVCVTVLALVCGGHRLEINTAPVWIEAATLAAMVEEV